MSFTDRFRDRMQLSGGSIRKDNLYSSRMLLKSTFKDDASYQNCMYLWSLGKIKKEDYEHDKPIDIRMYKRDFSSANGWTVKFQTLWDTEILTGDIYYNMEEDNFYICTEVFNIDGINYQGKFTLCNWILKWQDKNTGYIFEYPCHEINTTQYNSGEKSNNVITVGSSQHQITLPVDENTVEISTPQRFYLDLAKGHKTSFITTQNDTTSWLVGKKGVIKVTVMECATDNDTDRPDLGICDYIDPEKIKKTNNDIHEYYEVEKSIIRYSSLTIKSGGNEQWFRPIFVDHLGKPIRTAVPKWEVICPFMDELNIRNDGDIMYISIDNDDFIDEEFKINLTDDNDMYPSSVIVKIESLL